MLKGIPELLGAELLWTLAAMGHGDVLAVVDRNYPAHSLHQRVTTLAGVSVRSAMEAIGRVLPVDDFIELPVRGMVPDGDSEAELPVHRDVAAILSRHEGRSIEVAPLPRGAFYDSARTAFAAVLTAEAEPYSCFLMTKGVVFPSNR